MSETNKNQSSKDMRNYSAGIGLIFGTAIGTGLGIVLRSNIVVWAGIGTGAIIDAYSKK